MKTETNASRGPILGLFLTILLLLAFPLLILTSQKQQDIRQRASSPQPTIASSNNYNYISGYIYLDNNTDGEREYGEKGVNNVQLKITQKNLITFITSDQNGYFKYRFSNTDSTPTLTVELTLPNGYKTINTNPRTLNLQNNTKNILEFGIYPLK